MISLEGWSFTIKLYPRLNEVMIPHFAELASIFSVKIGFSFFFV